MQRAIMLARIQQHLIAKGKLKSGKPQGFGKSFGFQSKGDAKSSVSGSSLWKEWQVMNYWKANNFLIGKL